MESETEDWGECPVQGQPKLKRQKRDDKRLKNILANVNTANLKQHFGLGEYYKMFQAAEQIYKKGTIRNLKKYLKESPNRVDKWDSILASDYLRDESDRSIAKKEAKRPMQCARSKALVLPKRQYCGCLATKINPSNYTNCYHNYDDPKMEYQRYSSLVPFSAIQTCKWNKAKQVKDFDKAAILRSDFYKFSGASTLPSGVRRFMRTDPQGFERFLEEWKRDVSVLEYMQEVPLIPQMEEWTLSLVYL